MSETVTTRILHTPENARRLAAPPSWVWPLPRLDGVAPSILAATDGTRRDAVEIGYEGRASSRSFVPVFAAQDGIVTYAGTTGDSPTLCIDHAGGWSTQYSELEHLLVRPTDRFRRRRKERIRAGDVIGHARKTALRIRFGVSQLTDDGCVAHDPMTWMQAWLVLPWFAEPVTAMPSSA
jgi:murein DD-endopeptidase MepM/ murein hydrolase activator NlpD